MPPRAWGRHARAGLYFAPGTRPRRRVHRSGLFRDGGDVWTHARSLPHIASARDAALLSRLRVTTTSRSVPQNAAPCRIQMEHGTTKRTLHPIKILSLSYGLNPLLLRQFQGDPEAGPRRSQVAPPAMPGAGRAADMRRVDCPRVVRHPASRVDASRYRSRSVARRLSRHLHVLRPLDVHRADLTRDMRSAGRRPRRRRSGSSVRELDFGSRGVAVIPRT